MKETPLLTQYKKIKEKYKEEILLFRIGDFYETFLEDAERTSKALGITLTSKPVGKGIRVPLAGIPAKAADTYIARLLEQGFKVAICEQTKEGKKLMEREVVEVITPGTITITELLDEKSSYFVASFVESKNGPCAVAMCDITTGDFFYFAAPEDEAIKHLLKSDTKELVLIEGKNINIDIPVSHYSEIWYGSDSAKDVIRDYFGITNVHAFGFKEEQEVEASGLLLAYLKEKKKTKLGNITGIRRLNLKDTLYIDEKTARNLELVERIFEKRYEGTLFWSLNRMKTAMGKRFLKQTILFPSTNKDFIKRRLLRVETFFNDLVLSNRIDKELSGMGDMERKLSKIVQKKAGPKDVYLLKEDLKKVLNIVNTLKDHDFFAYDFNADDLISLINYIDGIVKENPPVQVEDFIKKGVYEDLDELVHLIKNTRGKLLEIEQREKEKTKIPTLKIGYNQVFGYYIEVTKTHLNKIPEYYIRKQTLTQSERFITEELKIFEEKILTAEEKIKEIEKKIFKEIRSKVQEKACIIKGAAEYIQEVDLSLGFAKIAIERGYIKPEITEDDILVIKDGRHPVMEIMSQEVFVPNDTHFDEENRVYIITGPNMAGKSTYLRQVALITIMAHMGSFVPTSFARIGITDRIFSRIGASDDITKGISTFMAEMVETGEILHSATRRSLIVLDEVGRGTSTYDGMSIAYAVVKYIAEKGYKTLFATHYHELGELSSSFKTVENYTMEIKEYRGKLYYLRKLKEGVCDRSYGIHVAELAGLPKNVIEEAKKILRDMEKRTPVKGSKGTNNTKQLSLFDNLTRKEKKIVEIIKDIDVDGLTPRDALNFIYKLKEELGA